MYIFQFVHVKGLFWKHGVECIETRDHSCTSILGIEVQGMSQEFFRKPEGQKLFIFTTFTIFIVKGPVVRTYQEASVWFIYFIWWSRTATARGNIEDLYSWVYQGIYLCIDFVPVQFHHPGHVTKIRNRLKIHRTWVDFKGKPLEKGSIKIESDPS